jgi:hypothetical protein
LPCRTAEAIRAMEDFAMRHAPGAVRPSDWDALTPRQKSALTRELIRRAHAARTREVGRMLLGWARYIRYRQRRRGARRACGEDDRMLRDAGVNRFEIGAAVRSGSSPDRKNR